jgi:tRNA U55 pseudouridine synthase TruB
MNVISKDELMRGLLDASALEGGLASGSGSEAHTAAISGLIPAYKEWGKTPLETLDALRAKYPSLAGLPLSYAGRLDPLAEGLMLVLVGEINKDRERYLHLNKTYEVEILFGVKTDTGDLFGVPEATAKFHALGELSESLDSGLPATNISDRDEGTINKKSNFDMPHFDVSRDADGFVKTLTSFVGKQQFPYPAYSSKTVQGKPLFQWMNEGRIDEIEIPKTDVEIYSLKILNMLENVGGTDELGGIGETDLSHHGIATYEITPTDILRKVEKALTEVKGDFRYDSIREGWKNILNISDADISNASDKDDTLNLKLIKIECACSSGTYMRVLAEEIGKKLGVPALAYSIKRTKVGEITSAVCI